MDTEEICYRDTKGTPSPIQAEVGAIKPIHNVFSSEEGDTDSGRLAPPESKESLRKMPRSNSLELRQYATVDNSTSKSTRPWESQAYRRRRHHSVFSKSEPDLTPLNPAYYPNKPLENVPPEMIFPLSEPYKVTIVRPNTPLMPEEYTNDQPKEAQPLREPSRTWYWNKVDRFTQVCPVVSQTRSLIQLMCGDREGARRTQNNFINKVLENVTGKLPEAPDLTNRSRWMEEMVECSPGFGEKRIHEICIPGSHNSATRITIEAGQPWVVCQRHTISAQLRGGIRYLDFRVCDDAGDEQLWASHGSLCSLLINHLEELRDFLDENSKEIVCVLIKKDWDRKLTAQGLDTLKRILIHFFLGKVADSSEAQCTIAELMARGKQLVFLETSLVFGDPISLWPTEWSWPETNSDHTTPLFSNLVKWGNQLRFSRGKITALECILTPSVHSVVTTLRPLSEVTKSVHRNLMSLLRSGWKAELNIVSFDYCADQIIEEVIRRNI
ncbi:PLC-like phosphodiesterase [Basidiobolus meristosporus CBS 931.73]|uniref:PLC-like phosphodiesterase n=1 Tax=Basidiobolus meristosporus CBS 931.73 TaxID=1314790 RepID=A0A1Y1Y9H9_9FUNG|nr:PLC-like phosphodiesterase [Basidiobolus meristosporus CBS 931.73]|eukprot:ORX94224.1 PLC-like phosphodiesterase [Basidiobolus meristosporus CBS 931.73]